MNIYDVNGILQMLFMKLYRNNFFIYLVMNDDSLVQKCDPTYGI